MSHDGTLLLMMDATTIVYLSKARYMWWKPNSVIWLDKSMSHDGTLLLMMDPTTIVYLSKARYMW
jgi:hypothetical protein